MLKPELEKALNDHLNAELFSAYLYYAMSAYFEAKSLRGSANWMRVQAQEEMLHVSKYFSYLVDRGGRVKLQAVAEPQNEWASPLAAFQDALGHEREITRLINELVDLAAREKDHATVNFLQWFVAEQVEEEASADEVVQRLKLAGEAGSGLFLLDRDLGARTFNPASAAE